MKKICIFLFIIVFCNILITNLVYATNTIIKAEYFIDIDPREGKGISIPPLDGAFNTNLESIDFEIDLNGICYGTHVRMQKADGLWGKPDQHIFFIESIVQDAEYFFDKDPGPGNGIKIQSKDGQFDNFIELFDYEIDISELTVGNHILYFRLQDNLGNWGQAKSYAFTFSGNIVASEYYIDHDPGEGKGISIPPLDGEFNTNFESIDFEIDLTGICPGTHYVYVRMKKADGLWERPQEKMFTIESFVQDAEYFFDNDPGEGNGIKIQPKDLVFDNFEELFEIDFDVSHLDVGMHNIYFRLQDNLGNWGPPVKSSSFKLTGAIIGAEYFFDIDPGEGNGIPIGESHGVTNIYYDDIKFDIQLPENLSLGPHCVYLRMKNEEGVWGLPQKRLFTVNGPQIIVAAEYYIDDDPGYGKGIALNAEDGAYDSDYEETEKIEIFASNLSLGLHTIYVRMQDITGNWGLDRAYTIEITDEWLDEAEVFAYTDSGEKLSVPLLPSDGKFDQTAEEFEGSIDTLNIPIGINSVYVRAKNSSGFWSQQVKESKFEVFVWDVGNIMPISWHLPDIHENVMILISRHGGAIGSFEPIASNTLNDGQYDWKINGSASEDCIISIVPVSNPYSAITIDPFTITNLSTSIQLTPIEKLKKYSFSLIEKRDYVNDIEIDTSWNISNPSIAQLDGNQLVALQNGFVVLSTEYNGQIYEKIVFMKIYFENFESEDNNSQLAATRLSKCEFMQGEMLDDKLDFFQIKLEYDSIVEIAYNSESEIADLLIEILDQSEKLLAKYKSNDGETIQFSIGLKKGDYYVKLTSTGDIDAYSTYDLVYQTFDFSPEPIQKDIMINQYESSHLTHLQDKREFFFKLESMQNVMFKFIPKTHFADFQVIILDSNGNAIVNQISEKGESFEIHSIYGKGNYMIQVKPVSVVDAINPFIISVNESGSLREHESNDISSQASFLSINEQMSGNLAGNNDVDFYLFHVNAPQYFSLYFKSDNKEKSYNINFYKDSENNLFNSFNVPQGKSIYFPFGLNIGKYYIKITGQGGESLKPYFFYISTYESTNLEIESNNTIKFANAISKGSGKKGRIYSNIDIDYYGFNINEKMPFWIDFTSETTFGDYQVSIVNENNQKIYSKESNDGKMITLINNRFPGNYYIKIENNGDVDQYKDYHLKIETNTDINPTYQIAGLSTISSISIEAPYVNIGIDEAVKLTASGHFSDASSKRLTNVIWTSIDPEILSIDDKGLASGISKGETTVVAILGGIVGRLRLYVDLSELTSIQHHGNLILAAGGGMADNNILRESTQYLADLIYLRFRQRLFEDEDIFYINPMPWHDINGDGYDNNIVDDDSPTVLELEQAISQWAHEQNSDGPLYIYLIDHGGENTYNLFPGEIVNSNQLNSWITSFQNLTERNVIIVIEACKSGTFIDELDNKENNRIIVTSTNEKDAYIDPKGTISFTQFFIDRLRTGDSINKSFTRAIIKLKNIGPPYSLMEPQLIDNSSFPSDNVNLGGKFVIANLFSEVISQTSDMTITGYSEFKIFVELSDVENITSVWAVVIPPYYTPPPISDDLLAPQTILPVIKLENINNNSIYEGIFSGFKSNGQYRVTFYAKNINNSVTISPPAIITIKNLKNSDGDVDGDGQLTLKDIIISLRMLTSVDISNQYSIFIDFKDINETGKFGLEEIIYLMMHIACNDF